MRAFAGSRTARLLVAAALTSYLLWISDPAAIAAAASSADWRWMLAAVGLVVIDRTLMAWRWISLLRPVSRDGGPPLGALMRVFFVSTFVGTFLPTSVGSDAVRAYGIMQHQVAGSTAVASVVLDRALGIVSMLLLGLGSALLLPAGAPPGVFVILALGGAASLALAAVIFVEPAGRAALAVSRMAPAGPLRRIGERMVEAIRVYRHHHGTLVGVLAASVGVQVLRVLQAWGLGRALGVAAPIEFYFVAIPVILLIMLLPVTVSGLGTGQAAFLWIFGTIGVPRPEAFALSILFVALGIVGNLPGGVLYGMGRTRSAA